jgi:hypothetical protein
MMRLIPFAAAAAAAVVLELGTAGAAMPTSPEAPPAPTTILVARKQTGVIPENCLMDPFKKVYVCCTREGDSEPVCTEHPLDTDWPAQPQQRMQPFKQVKPSQSQPLLLQPAQ